MHAQATCYNVDNDSFNVAIESFLRVERLDLAGMAGIALVHKRMEQMSRRLQ